MYYQVIFTGAKGQNLTRHQTVKVQIILLFRKITTTNLELNALYIRYSFSANFKVSRKICGLCLAPAHINKGQRDLSKPPSAESQNGV